VEANAFSLVDEVWVTVASEATVLKRLSEKPGLSRAEALARINSQMASKDRIKYADEIIDTDCRLEELKTKVAELWYRRQGKSPGENPKTVSR
jgi:dephospho-CoA kinase